jgi:2-polyprenyl-3-methyl-5-hydroxy-6-metoxy-1,4-benzoquinol methylase
MKAAKNTMTRIDRSKRALGTALKRDKPSQAAEVLVARGLVKGRVLDYGCGFGFDANQFGWESYDPYYQPREPEGQFDTIVCTLVLNALSRNNRARVISRVRELIAREGSAYFAVARNIPKTGKMGVHHSLQNYVVLTLPSVFADKQLEIYQFHKDSHFEDKTKDYVSRRDRRRDK